MKNLFTFAMVLAATTSMTAQNWTDVSTAAELQSALSELKPEVRLTADITCETTAPLLVDCAMVLDLNGHSLDLQSSLVHRGVEIFEIVDNSEGGTGAVTSSSYAVTCATPGEVIIRGGTFTSSSRYAVISIEKYGVASIKGGLFKAQRHNRAIHNKGHLLIDGGTIIGADGDLEPVYTECGEPGYGITEVKNGAIYAGNRTPSKCFDNSYWTDGEEVEEGQTILPEGVYDGGAIVLDEKWAIPGTFYINYHVPEGVQVQPNFTHYFTPGTAVALPECDYRNDVPYAGWSTSADDTKSFMKEIPADANQNYQLYPVWKYVNIPDGVTPDFLPESINPEPNTQIESIVEITLSYGEDVTVELNENAEDFGYIINRTTGEKVSKINITTGGWTGEVYLKAEPAVTTNGTYQVFIPAGVFGNDDWYYDDYQAGRCNPDLRYVYTIKNRPQGTTPTEVDPENGSIVNNLSKVTITFPNQADITYSYDDIITIKDANGNTISEIDFFNIESAPEKDNVMIITLPEPISAPGTYTMDIPEGFFSFNWWESDCSALSYTWTIANSSVNSIVVEADSSAEYFTLQGIRVTNPRPGEMLIRRQGGKTEKIIIR